MMLIIQERKCLSTMAAEMAASCYGFYGVLRLRDRRPIFRARHRCLSINLKHEKGSHDSHRARTKRAVFAEPSIRSISLFVRMSVYFLEKRAQYLELSSQRLSLYFSSSDIYIQDLYFIFRPVSYFILLKLKTKNFHVCKYYKVVQV